MCLLGRYLGIFAGRYRYVCYYTAYCNVRVRWGGGRTSATRHTAHSPPCASARAEGDSSSERAAPYGTGT